MFKEFRDFAIKGNMIDLAIGVIIGAAFGAIVSSIVDDIFMPLIGIIIGGIDFSSIVLTVGEAKVNIGLFINAVVKFAIIAFVLFLVMLHIKPDYVQILWTDPLGIKMSVAALVAQVAGALVIKKIVDIKV